MLDFNFFLIFQVSKIQTSETLCSNLTNLLLLTPLEQSTRRRRPMLEHLKCSRVSSVCGIN